MTRRILDISRPVAAGIPVWPGDTPYEYRRAWKIGGGATYTFPDGKRDLLDGAGYEVWFGQVINEKWDWDINYFNANLNIEDNNSRRFHSTGYSDTLKGFGLDVDRVYFRSSRFSPFITAGAGYIDDGRDPGYDELFVKLGIGALIDVAHFSGGGVLLRAEMLRRVGLFDPRFFAYYEDSDLSWRAARAGTSHRLTKASPPAPRRSTPASSPFSRGTTQTASVFAMMCRCQCPPCSALTMCCMRSLNNF